MLDLLSLGDAMAVHLGLDVKQHKRRLLLLSSLLTALVVAACGTIGFVGLVVPHIMRRLLGPGHRFARRCDPVWRAFYRSVIRRRVRCSLRSKFRRNFDLAGRCAVLLSLLLRRSRLGTLS